MVANPGDTSAIMTVAEAQTYATRGRKRWVPVAEAIECLEEQALQAALPQ